MKREIREQWTAALRSGDYKQGRGRMYRCPDNSFCCLGVLGHLLGAEKVDGYYDGLRFVDYSTVTFNSMLPEVVADQIGLTYDMQCTLSEMNDDGKSFAEIADFIDRRALHDDEKE